MLTKIGFLSSKGARKAGGTDLTAQEARFLKEAIKEVVHRAAELAHTPDGDLPEDIVVGSTAGLKCRLADLDGSTITGAISTGRCNNKH